MRQESKARQKERQTRGEVAHAFISDLWPHWRPTRQQGLWVVRIAIVFGMLIVLVLIGYSHSWTGFGSSVSDMAENQDIQRMKSLWDWLKLLIVPAVLAGGGHLFARSENRRTERSADQGAMDAALQSYLDQMSILLIDKHLHGEYRPHGDTRVTARARTLTVLEELDGGRKRSVV